jgi:hypothetical protein
VARFGLVAVALGVGVLWVRPSCAHCAGAGEVAGLAFVATAGLATATVYDVVKIASDEQPSDLWALSQAAIASPLALLLASAAAEGPEVNAIPILFAGWFAALGGFGLGSLAVDRARSGGVGAAIGLTAVSVEHATLTLVGHRPTEGGFALQTIFAAPGIPAGLAWALDARTRADFAGGITLAAFASVSLMHGFVSHVHHEADASAAAVAPRMPRVALGCSEPGSCTFALSGTW